MEAALHLWEVVALVVIGHGSGRRGGGRKTFGVVVIKVYFIDETERSILGIVENIGT